MSIASVHIADVGAPRALSLLRGPRGPIEGLLSSESAVAARLHGAPMPGRLALIAFWADEAALDAFEATHPYAARFQSGWSVRLTAMRAFGSWPGLDPAVARTRAVPEDDGPVVVCTLGRLRIPRTAGFLRASRPAEAAALAAQGFLWGTALARPPFVATMSLWRSAADAADYAYADGASHPHAIAADRRRPFHHRSAFVRFRPTAVRGSLGGSNPLEEDLLTVRDGTDRTSG